jgi:hypothetical protein
MIKTDIGRWRIACGRRCGGDQHTADLFAVTTTHGHRCQLATRKEGMNIETCKRHMETGKAEGYSFVDEEGLHYAPTPEGTFAPFGSNPWGACKGRQAGAGSLRVAGSAVQVTRRLRANV